MSVGDFLTLGTLALAVLIATPIVGNVHLQGDGGRTDLP